MSKEDEKSLTVFTYPISYDELVETWIQENEKFGHCLIIYEPKKHENYLKEINLPYSDQDFYLAELMCLEFIEFSDAKKLLHCFNYRTGPFVQLWSSGKLITDNIDSRKFETYPLINTEEGEG